MKDPSPPDDRSMLAKAYQWVAVASGIAMTMVLPPLVGYWIDQWLGWRGVWVSVGAVAGLLLGFRRLLTLASSNTRS